MGAVAEKNKIKQKNSRAMTRTLRAAMDELILCSFKVLHCVCCFLNPSRKKLSHINHGRFVALGKWKENRQSPVEIANSLHLLLLFMVFNGVQPVHLSICCLPQFCFTMSPCLVSWCIVVAMLCYLCHASPEEEVFVSEWDPPG